MAYIRESVKKRNRVLLTIPVVNPASAASCARSASEDTGAAADVTCDVEVVVGATVDAAVVVTAAEVGA